MRHLGPLVLVGLLLAACSSDPEKVEPKVPEGLEVPSGVTLTDPGATLAVGKPASVVYELGDGVATVVTGRVAEVKQGSIADFRFFSLDAASKKATPYYVTIGVRNEGPAGLGGVSVPFVAHTSANTIYPPNAIVGEFKPCPSTPLPESFLAGAAAKQCLVFLIPEGEKLETIDLQTGEQADAVHWTP